MSSFQKMQTGCNGGFRCRLPLFRTVVSGSSATGDVLFFRETNPNHRPGTMGKRQETRATFWQEGCTPAFSPRTTLIFLFCMRGGERKELLFSTLSIVNPFRR